MILLNGKRVMSGMRPTGRLHIGHLLGALSNWKKLQHEYECFFSIVDWHALTTAYKDPGRIKEDTRELAIDYLSSGIYPEKCVLYRQSDIQEIAELHLLISMVIPVSWVERIPTYKEQIQELGQDIATYGFLGYPVLQTADIAAMKGELVPVGKDQLPHLEFSRELIRRFHYICGKEIFPEPQPLLTETPLVPGIDGRKMSKSYNNAIYISDSPEEIKRKINKTITDPEKIYKGDPGRPEICNVFAYHKAFSKREKIDEVDRDCRSGALGCVDDKKQMSDTLIEALAPIRERRRELEKDDGEISAILKEGAEKARSIARQTLIEAREALGIY